MADLHYQDSGWAWLVLVGSFVSYFIADGWCFSFSVLFPELLLVFDESNSKTALIGAILYGLPQLLSPFVCALITVFGCRFIGIVGGFILGISFILSSVSKSVDFLIVMTGIVGAFGLSLIYLTALIAVTLYFNKRRALATSIAVTGSALGSFAFPLFLNWLVKYYSWRGALIILGGVAFQIIAASGLFRPINKIESSDVVKGSKRSPWQIMKLELKTAIYSMGNKAFTHNWKFITFVAANFILFLWVGVPFLFIVDHGIQLGFNQAALLASAIGVGRLFGQLAFGYLGDVNGLNPVIVYALATCVTGIAVIFEPLCTSFLALTVFSLLFGFFVSVTYVLAMICIIDIVGLEHSTGAFGLFQLPQGISTMLGTPLAAWLYTITGNYSLTFYVTGAWILFAGLIMLPIPFLRTD